jgi:Uma2 family endonuclease
MRALTLLRAEDFARVAPVLGSCELVRGEIVPMSPGGVRHSQITARITGLLDQYAREHRLGRVLTGEAGVIVARGPDTVRGADVAFVSYERLPADRQPAGFLDVAPELIVEVMSEDVSWKEMEQKIAEYHAFGVDTVWVVEPRLLAVRVYPRGGDPFVLQQDTSIVAAIPAGFSCPVSELVGG